MMSIYIGDQLRRGYEVEYQPEYQAYYNFSYILSRKAYQNTHDLLTTNPRHVPTSGCQSFTAIFSGLLYQT